MKTLFLIALAAMAGLRPPGGTPVLSLESSSLESRPAPSPRSLVIAVAASQVGVTEATGRNDGEVDKFLAAVGLGGTRNPYCAAFNYWVGKEALGSANPYPRSAWSPDHLKGGRRVTAGNEILPGETFGLWFAAKGRIAHTGLVEKREGGNLVTIEANTSATAASGSAADRDGQGVFRKRRPWRTVHSTRDWLAR